ncbi:MAG: hypothetical protein HGA75_05970 [Thiobacillus sp.]|nr:hypothetical protein [Thiobacillus sp.]
MTFYLVNAEAGSFVAIKLNYVGGQEITDSSQPWTLEGSVESAAGDGYELVGYTIKAGTDLYGVGETDFDVPHNKYLGEGTYNGEDVTITEAPDPLPLPDTIEPLAFAAADGPVAAFDSPTTPTASPTTPTTSPTTPTASPTTPTASPTTPTTPLTLDDVFKDDTGHGQGLNPPHGQPDRPELPNGHVNPSEFFDDNPNIHDV